MAREGLVAETGQVASKPDIRNVRKYRSKFPHGLYDWVQKIRHGDADVGRSSLSMTKDELRALEMHALVGRVVDLERMRDELAGQVSRASARASAERLRKRQQAVADDLAAAASVYRMRLKGTPGRRH
jgi:hypothetical protein